MRQQNFGTANTGPNYGIVFTATIASGLVGSFVLQRHHPQTQAQWTQVLIGFGCMSALAALLGLTFRPGRTRACCCGD